MSRKKSEKGGGGEEDQRIHPAPLGIISVDGVRITSRRRSIIKGKDRERGASVVIENDIAKDVITS